MSFYRLPTCSRDYSVCYSRLFSFRLMIFLFIDRWIPIARTCCISTIPCLNALINVVTSIALLAYYTLWLNSRRSELYHTGRREERKATEPSKYVFLFFSTSNREIEAVFRDTLILRVTLVCRIVLRGGGLFTQGSYNELRKFVTNYIHYRVWKKTEEKELMMSVCDRSPSRVEN